VRARVFLDRAVETAGFNEPSQDYVAVRHDATRLCFAVTDGVSTSFMGEIAAQVLAVGLVDFLYAIPPDTQEDAFSSAVLEHVGTLAKSTQDKIATWPIPSSVTGILRETLEEKRLYGSEAMFVCGSVDFGGRQQLARFAWLGDASMRLILRSGERHDLSGLSADRWSTRLGARGNLGCKTLSTKEIRRIIAYSDGMIPALDSILTLPDSKLGPALAALAHRADNDDTALVDIGLGWRAMPGKQNSALWMLVPATLRGRNEEV
jgi:hypothetical protein